MRVIKFPRWTKWSIFTLHERTVEIKYLKYSNLARFEEGMTKNNTKCFIHVGTK